MKKTSSLILVLATSVALFSCGGEPDSGTSQAPGTASALGLKLDNGAKWPVNEATRVGMAEMQKLLTDFAASTAGDHAALGKSLQSEANVIIQKCTMTGEAHDQLHLVLLPMLDAINQLTTGNGGKAECETLRQLLGEYRSHFAG